MSCMISTYMSLKIIKKLQKFIYIYIYIYKLKKIKKKNCLYPKKKKGKKREILKHLYFGSKSGFCKILKQSYFLNEGEA